MRKAIAMQKFSYPENHLFAANISELLGISPSDPEATKDCHPPPSTSTISGTPPPIMSARSADGSAKSTSAKSYSTYNSTSTYVYAGSDGKGHEPYETFQTKVLDLTREICDAQEVQLQQKRGGSYNRVVIVRAIAASEKIAGIFRIPRNPQLPEDEENRKQEVDVNIQDQVAVSQLLQVHQIPAPNIIAFDASANNAIGSPYVLLELATGVALEDVYGDFSLQEKKQIAESLADFLARMEQVRFSQCGAVRAESRGRTGTPIKASTLTSPIDKLLTIVRGFDTAGIFGYGTAKDDTTYASTSAQELIRDLLKAHLELAVSDWDAESEAKWGASCDVELWRGLRTIFEEFCGLGFFSELDENSHTGSILYHWDLEPRNILVRRIDAEKETLGGQDAEPAEHSKAIWIIDKVIDWDKVQAVPPIFARKPPVWLWDFLHEQYCSKPDKYEEFTYDGDVDLLPASRYDHGQSTFSPDDRALRTYFEECFAGTMQKIYPGYNIEAYRDEAYGRGSWVRRIARFALNDLGSGEDIKRFERLKQDWAKGRLQYVQAGLADLSLDALECSISISAK